MIDYNYGRDIFLSLIGIIRLYRPPINGEEYNILGINSWITNSEMNKDYLREDEEHKEP